MIENIYDITIIGGGPVGLFAAFYAGLRNARVKIIDSLVKLGGQPNHLYSMKNIYDIPAYPQITGEELTQQLLQQLSRFKVDYALEETAEGLEVIDYRQANIFCIETDKNRHYSRTIIIAAGNGAFSPRKLNIKNIEDHSDQVSYHIEDIHAYTGKDVVVCGGGDSAVDWALSLESIAKQVSIIHRRDQFRAMESSVENLKNSSVKIYTPYLPDQLLIEDGDIIGILAKKARADETEFVPCDQLIVSYGFNTSLGPLKQWGFKIERNAIKVNHQFETNIPGIFAIGDVATYSGKVKIIASGFGEAPQAINNALTFIDPSNTQAPVHSSELFEGE